jgi:structural maintenance of chromosome 2
LLKEEITPKFEKLRKEKALYLEFQKTEAEIERLKKLVVAFDYHLNQSKLNSSETDFKKKSKKIEELKELNEVAQTELVETNEQMKQLAAKKQKEAGGQLGKFEEKTEKLSESLVRLKTQTDNKRESVKEESKKHEALITSRQEVSLLWFASGLLVGCNLHFLLLLFLYLAC